VVEFESLEELAAAFSPQQGVTVGRWFGKQCLKVEGRVFAARSGDAMAFKLPEEALSQALQLEGAHLFDPRGTGHPMKEWVEIPAGGADAWPSSALVARDYVAGAAEAKKTEVISGLMDARQMILAAAGALLPEKRGLVFLGKWSAKELLAHLIGWDYTNLEAAQDILAGRTPEFWSHYDRDWQSYNAHLVVTYGQDDWAELTAAVRQSHRQLIDHLRTVPADEYLRRRKIVSLLQAETKDERIHHRQLVRFGERSG
jgi:hypothetical protein